MYINKVPDSVNVDENVVKFVLYHEFLHAHISGHGPDFKAREHLFKGYEECEAFLKEKMNQFDIKDW